ncbi:MAG: hypothetical protein KY444_00005 [Gemmatimonadetes bacterium]|nr:hypothetical protein [Gemmatimonadota bacterium]
MKPSTRTMVVLLALAACGDEDRTPAHFTPSNDRLATSAGDSALRPAAAVPILDTLPKKAPPQDTFALAFAPLPYAGARGTGQVAAAGKATAISVSLQQAAWGQSYEGSIRQGACDAMGPAVASLNPATADSLGRGQASSDVSVPIDSLTKKPHVVVYGRGGRGEACAAIPSAAPRPAPPPPAPAATERPRALPPVREMPSPP